MKIDVAIDGKGDIHHALDAIVTKTLALGGTITGEHGVGIEKVNQMCMQFRTAELEAFEYEYRQGGVRYSAPEGMHDDGVCALALAIHAKSKPAAAMDPENWAAILNYDDVEIPESYESILKRKFAGN